jgi:hypothetical protein
MQSCWGSRVAVRTMRDAHGAACLKAARKFPLAKQIRPYEGWQAWTVHACMAGQVGRFSQAEFTRLILMNSAQLESATKAYEVLWETGLAGMCDAQVFELIPEVESNFSMTMQSMAQEVARLRGVALVLFREKNRYVEKVTDPALTQQAQMALWGVSNA